MSHSETTRRELIGGAAALAIAGKVANASPADSALPRRLLGRTGERVTMIGMGLAPLGSEKSSIQDVDRVVSAAFDQGIRYFDVSPDYGNAESKFKSSLKSIRDRIYLVTKVNPDRPTVEGVQRQIEESLVRMGVDRIDAIHVHNLGDWNMDTLFAKGGCIEGLKDARKRGLIRHVGISGHMRPGRFVTAIETGEIDLTMNQLNFVDRATYRFDEEVLPAARKKQTGIVAMKVLGGALGWRYDGATKGVFADHYSNALRYSLGIKGVACAVIGLATEAEVTAAVSAARAYKPLSTQELAALLDIGVKLAENRKSYYGPVTG